MAGTRTALRLRRLIAEVLLPAAALVACLTLAAPGAAQTLPDNPLAERESVVLSADRNDMQFLAGKAVTITATVPDDVFAAGRSVTFTQAQVGTAIVAGGEITVNGGSIADLIAATASLTIDGRIEDDVMAAGRDVLIAPDGLVEGDARLAAERITVRGQVSRSLRAAARTFTLEGSVDGKVDLVAESIVIGPNARIGGDLVYRSGQEPQIAEGAIIEGEVRRLELHLPNLRRVVFALIGIGIFLALSWLTAIIVLLLAVQIAFPGFGISAATRAVAKPLSNFARGLAQLLVGSVLAVAAIVSVVGMPIGFAVLTVLALGKLFALAAGSLAVGLGVRRLMRSGDPGGASQVGWLIAGFFVLLAVFFVPWIGGLAVALVLTTAFGAVSAEVWDCLRREP